MPVSAAAAFEKIASVRPEAGTPVRTGTAVVLGGSVAGLLAARVLADHADRVLIVERDDTGTGDAVRHGVPQGGQVHALLGAGSRQLERWFPGFTGEAVAAGALIAGPRQRNSYVDGVAKLHRSDLDLITATRPFLEGRIRDRVLSLPNVTVLRGRVTGLEFGASAVTGVQAGSQVHAADLVVDATGRASRLGDWLTAGGWDAPVLTRQTTGINYATAFFAREPGPPRWNAVLAMCTARLGGDLAGAAFAAVERDRWVVMMGGYGECRPGASAEDMIRRCRQDFPREFGEVAAGGLLGDVATYRQGDSRRRDFPAAGRLPARLLAVGDAVASFNPIYGQGMSSAALHASCLSLFLRSGAGLDRPARSFFELQKVIVDAAWRLSTSADTARPSVPVTQSRGQRLASWVSGRVVHATITDAVVNRRFDAVANMLAHPGTLARPAILARSLLIPASRRPAPSPPLESATRE